MGNYWAQISEKHQLREETSHLYPQVLTDLQETAEIPTDGSGNPARLQGMEIRAKCLLKTQRGGGGTAIQQQHFLAQAMAGHLLKVRGV